MAIANVICFLLFCVNRFIRTLKLKSSAAARTRAAAARAEAAVAVTRAAAAVAAARSSAFLAAETAAAAREIRHNEFLDQLMRLPTRPMRSHNFHHGRFRRRINRSTLPSILEEEEETDLVLESCMPPLPNDSPMHRGRGARERLGRHLFARLPRVWECFLSRVSTKNKKKKKKSKT
ncbi:hypothetical protein TorRG33x02_052320 [Trema orientale]|uniref:Uncharacterized protein n=1 Tax=Trema orientale TaxID=63057 RepID=A0A2P5FMH2_TREOI|nr:hypothetical protein TorRG33x02_052320 [Trema orientale]